jgi:hypothetical protein
MAGDWQRLASWLTGLSLMLSQGRTMPVTFPAFQFLIFLIKIHAIDSVRATH